MGVMEETVLGLAGCRGLSKENSSSLSCPIVIMTQLFSAGVLLSVCGKIVFIFLVEFQREGI